MGRGGRKSGREERCRRRPKFATYIRLKVRLRSFIWVFREKWTPGFLQHPLEDEKLAQTSAGKQSKGVKRPTILHVNIFPYAKSCFIAQSDVVPKHEN